MKTFLKIWLLQKSDFCALGTSMHQSIILNQPWVWINYLQCSRSINRKTASLSTMNWSQISGLVLASQKFYIHVFQMMSQLVNSTWAQKILSVKWRNHARNSYHWQIRHLQHLSFVYIQKISPIESKSNDSLEKLFFSQSLELNVKEAKKEMKYATHVKEDILAAAVTFFKKNNILICGSPYKADFQLAYWEEIGFTNGTITVDSDLFALGSQCTIGSF